MALADTEQKISIHSGHQDSEHNKYKYNGAGVNFVFFLPELSQFNTGISHTL